MTAIRHSLRPLLTASFAIALIAFAVTRANAETPPASASSAATPAAPVHPQVEFKTSQGDFVIELFPDKAPKTVANFLQYVKDGFYDGTVFHRVIPGYLVQGGLYTRDLRPKRTLPPIPDEANNGLSNLRGTIAAARGPDPDSATAQFFVNLVDNDFLDHAGPSNYGYAVFGKVTSGMDVIDKIAKVATATRSGHQNVPAADVTITKASRKQ